MQPPRLRATPHSRTIFLSSASTYMHLHLSCKPPNPCHSAATLRLNLCQPDLPATFGCSACRQPHERRLDRISQPAFEIPMKHALQCIPPIRSHPALRFPRSVAVWLSFSAISHVIRSLLVLLLDRPHHPFVPLYLVRPESKILYAGLSVSTHAAYGEEIYTWHQ
jgi:hypothetical protein